MAVTNIYADGDDVQALYNVMGGVEVTFGPATKPTLAQVEGWLDQLAAEVDSILTARGYSTIPASGTNDKLMIGRYVSQKAAAVAFHAGAMWDDTPDKVKLWEDEWRDFLKALEDGKRRLIDQTSARARMGTRLARRYIED